MPTIFTGSAIPLAVLSVCALYAQAAAAQTPQLMEVTITGNPLGASDLIAPSAQYSGDGLLLRSKTTLGETLDGTPGVSSTYFGPNASRPIIRGQDGDRIRILNNGGGLLDASSLSYDHSVAADPISIERIEVLRGPGALQYGGSAVGGVVNVIDNRIPREALFDEKGGVSGKVDLSLGTGNKEKSAGVLVEAGTNRYAIHVDAMNRDTKDVTVPIYIVCNRTAGTFAARSICNSASKVSSTALGGSIFFDQGYLGASVSGYRSNYGTVAEPNVNIGMKSDRFALEGEIKNLGSVIQSVKGQYSKTDYTHTEFTNTVPGTVFKSRGSDMRFEARHAKFGNLEGLVGVQMDDSQFSADGDEAFAPYSRTRQNAFFAFEEYKTGWGKLTFGGRVESVKVESLGNPNPALAKFVPSQRDYKPTSYAIGSLWNITPQWQLTGNLAYTERAPKDYELFANGPHIATRAYEIGNNMFAKEQATQFDVGVAWKSAFDSFAFNAYSSNFKNYIGLVQSAGVTRNQSDGEVNSVEDPNNTGFSKATGAVFSPLNEFRYQQFRARFTGFEASGNIRLIDGASPIDLALRADVVNATNLNTGQPLSRIPPMRLGATLKYASGPFGANFGVDYSAAQKSVPAGDRAAAGNTRFNAGATYRVKAGPINTLLYARLDNITNTLAYSPTSILTSTAFPNAPPLPGRNLKVGLQTSF